MNDWNEYALILAIHRARTLRAAAVLLNTTHTTVSRRLDAMHKRRGALVFEKHPSGFVSTPLGEALISTAQEIEQLIGINDRAQRAHGDSINGSITLSLSEAMAQYLLMPDISEFIESYPGIQLRIICSENLANLDKSEADIVIRGAKELPEHLVGRRLFPFALSYYGDENYIKNTPFENRRWIVPANVTDQPTWLANCPYPDLPIAFSINDIVTRFTTLQQGYGLARAACFMADTTDNLMRLPTARIEEQVDIWVLTHPDLRESPRIQLLMNFLVNALKKKEDLIRGRLTK